MKKVTYINTVDPVTNGTERTVTGDVIEQHHLVTKIGEQTPCMWEGIYAYIDATTVFTELVNRLVLLC